MYAGSSLFIHYLATQSRVDGQEHASDENPEIKKAGQCRLFLFNKNYSAIAEPTGTSTGRSTNSTYAIGALSP